METDNKKIKQTETKVKELFKLYKVNGSTFRIDIDEEDKVRKIEQLKDYLNTILIDYDISITFAGGQFWDRYTTILKLIIIE